MQVSSFIAELQAKPAGGSKIDALPEKVRIEIEAAFQMLRDGRLKVTVNEVWRTAKKQFGIQISEEGFRKWYHRSSEHGSTEAQ